MLGKVCPGHGQEAVRHSGRRPRGGEAASAPPPSDPHVCIMSIDGETVNRGSPARTSGARGIGWLRAFPQFAGGTSKRPVAQRPSRESGFDLRTWRQRATQRAWFCLGRGKASIVYTAIASRRLFLGVILPQRRHPGTRRRAERQAAYPGPMPRPSLAGVTAWETRARRGLSPSSRLSTTAEAWIPGLRLRSGSARDDEGESGGRKGQAGGRNTLRRPGNRAPPQRSFTVSIATKVEVCATWGKAEMRSPRTRR